MNHKNINVALWLHLYLSVVGFLDCYMGVSPVQCLVSSLSHKRSNHHLCIYFIKDKNPCFNVDPLSQCILATSDYRSQQIKKQIEMLLGAIKMQLCILIAPKYGYDTNFIKFIPVLCALCFLPTEAIDLSSTYSFQEFADSC